MSTLTHRRTAATTTTTPARTGALATLALAATVALLAGCSSPPSRWPGAKATPGSVTTPEAESAAQAMQALRRKLATVNQDALNQSLQDALRSGQAAMDRRNPDAARAALAPLGRYGAVADFPSIPVQVLLAKLSQTPEAPNTAAFRRHVALGGELTEQYRADGWRPSSADQPIPVYTRFELRERMDALGWSLRGEPVPQPLRIGSSPVMLLNALDERGQARALYFRLDYLPVAAPNPTAPNPAAAPAPKRQ